jgi:hypothetical protein
VSKNRLTRQFQQEQVSRGQMVARFSEFGWISSSPPDLGEDFIVSVYNDGVATGIGFFVQLKSVTSLNDLRTGDVIKYRFKVSDLKHWQQFALPVVLIVWDVNLQEGRWILIDDVIIWLNTIRPGWRDLKTRTTVDIPWRNSTDDHGLGLLKASIGDSVYPLISQGRELEVSFALTFPDSEEGREYKEAVDRHIREGEPIILRGEFIQQIQFSEWWAQWFGDYDREKMEIHLSGLSSRDPYVFDISLNPHSHDLVSLRYLEFRLIQGGTELLVFSNEHTNFPIHFVLTLCRDGERIIGELSHSFRETPRDPELLLQILQFKMAMADEGTLQVRYRNGDEQLHNGTYQGDPSTSPNPRYVELVQKLCVIQNNTQYFLLIPEGGIEDGDISPILELADIFERGFTINRNATVTSEFKDKALHIMAEVHRQGKPIHLRLSAPESHVVLFEKDIQVGPMIRDITAIISDPADEFERRITTAEKDEFINVELINAVVVEYFPNWASYSLEDVLAEVAE